MSSNTDAVVRIQAKIVGAEAAQRDLERINKKLGDPRAVQAMEVLQRQLAKVQQEFARGAINTSAFQQELKKLAGQTAALKELRQALADIGLESRKLSAADVASPLNAASRRDSIGQGLLQGGLQGLGAGGAGNFLQRGAGGIAQFAALVAARVARAGGQAIINPRNLAQAAGSLPIVGAFAGPAIGNMLEAGKSGLGGREALTDLMNQTGGSPTSTPRSEFITGMTAQTLNEMRALRERRDSIGKFQNRFEEQTERYRRLAREARQRQNIDAKIETLNERRSALQRDADPRRQMAGDLATLGADFSYSGARLMSTARGGLVAAGAGIQDNVALRDAFALGNFGLSPELAGSVTRASRSGGGSANASAVDALNPVLSELRGGTLSGAEQTELLKMIAEEMATQNETGIKIDGVSLATLSAQLSLSGIRGIEGGRLARNFGRGAQALGTGSISSPLDFQAVLSRSGGRLDRRSVSEAMLSLQTQSFDSDEMRALMQGAARRVGADPTSPEGILAIQRTLGTRFGRIGADQIRRILSGSGNAAIGSSANILEEAAGPNRVDAARQRIADSEANTALARYDAAGSFATLEQAQNDITRALQKFSGALSSIVNNLQQTTEGFAQ